MANRRSRKTYRPTRRAAPDSASYAASSYSGYTPTFDQLLTYTPPRRFHVEDASPLEFEDRRDYYPEPYTRPARTAPYGSPARVVIGHPQPTGKIRSSGLLGPLPAIVAFERPRQVAVCQRRQTRRQVLHAFGKAGHRVSRPKRTPLSGISCRG